MLPNYKIQFLLMLLCTLIVHVLSFPRQNLITCELTKQSDGTSLLDDGVTIMESMPQKIDENDEIGSLFITESVTGDTRGLVVTLTDEVSQRMRYLVQIRNGVVEAIESATAETSDASQSGECGEQDDIVYNLRSGDTIYVQFFDEDSELTVFAATGFRGSVYYQQITVA